MGEAGEGININVEFLSKSIEFSGCIEAHMNAQTSQIGPIQLVFPLHNEKDIFFQVNMTRMSISSHIVVF